MWNSNYIDTYSNAIYSFILAWRTINDGVFHGYGIDLGTSSVLSISRGGAWSFMSLQWWLWSIPVSACWQWERGPEHDWTDAREYSAVKPLKGGVIADFEITEIMLKHYIGTVGERRRLFRPRIAVCIPAEITSVEKSGN